MDAPIADFTQTGRLLSVNTPLGEDVLLLEHLDIDEGVSRLFEIRAGVRAKRTDLKAADLVGGPIDVTLDLGDGRSRTWNGLVTGLDEGPSLAAGRHYVVTARPRLWLMSQRSDCRIFLDKSSPDAVEQLAKEHGIVDLDIRVVRRPPPQPYSVQWNETDLAYFTRRLDEDGLFYWFDQKKGHHTLVVADHQSAYRDGPEPEVRLAFGSADRSHIIDWRRSFVFSPGKRAARDWNFETPLSPPAGEVPSLVKLPGNTSYELYHYPGRFADPDRGEATQRLRMQSTEADYERLGGRSMVRTLAPGQTFTPHEVPHPDDPQEKQVVTHIVHRAADTTYEPNAGQPSYENDFSVIPARVPATPHRATPRPRIDGLQIAVIAGPQGEEIHTDQYGRIKLKFPWDRRARGDGTDTVWIRVGQNWAGGTWGAQVIPRVGMEVLVAYQEGDPDRPMVVGVVPNPVNKVPYDLPGNKTKMVVRSNTYKGAGYNEISMEDMNGQENLFTHAQKDKTTKVLNNATARTDANLVDSIGQNHSFEVGQNSNQQVGGSMSLVVGAVGGMATAALGAAMSGLSGQTAGLLGDAMGVAMQAAGGGMGGNSGSSAPASAPSSAAGAAQAATAANSGSGSTGSDALSQLASGFTGLVGSGAIGGMLGGAATDAARSGVNDASAASMQSSGGSGMSNAASQIASMVGQMMGGAGGTLNTLVSQFQNNQTGVASTEQVGMTKVVNVGQTAIENVGKAKKVVVGEELTVEVGKSLLIMQKDGTILLKGVKIYIDGEEHIQHSAEVIDLN